MFAILCILLIVCGILLLIKAKNIHGKNGLSVILGVSGIILIICGIVLIYYVFIGVIELPLQ